MGLSKKSNEVGRRCSTCFAWVVVGALTHDKEAVTSFRFAADLSNDDKGPLNGRATYNRSQFNGLTPVHHEGNGRVKHSIKGE